MRERQSGYFINVKHQQMPMLFVNVHVMLFTEFVNNREENVMGLINIRGVRINQSE